MQYQFRGSFNFFSSRPLIFVVIFSWEIAFEVTDASSFSVFFNLICFGNVINVAILWSIRSILRLKRSVQVDSHYAQFDTLEQLLVRKPWFINRIQLFLISFVPSFLKICVAYRFELLTKAKNFVLVWRFCF